jgi:hypothetical protein
MRGGSGRRPEPKKSSIPPKKKIKNGETFFSVVNEKTGLPKLVPLTNILKYDITKYFRMFKDHKNIDTLQISEDGKRLVMKDANGNFKYVSIIYARGHGLIVKGSTGPSLKCPNNIAIIQTGKGDYLDHSVFSALAPVVFKLLFQSNTGTDIGNFKNFLKLKSGYSVEYGPDALINSVSYKTPGSYVKNVLLTSGHPGDDYFNYRGVFDITNAVVGDTIDYNDVTHKDHRLDLTGETERSSFRTILSKLGATVRGIITGDVRKDLTNSTKYTNIEPLTSMMRTTEDLTTERLVLELQNRETLGYKDNIIFLIIFACGAWDDTVTDENARVIMGQSSENFGVGGTIGEPTPLAPFEVTTKISGKVGLPPGQTTIYSEQHRDPHLIPE